MTRALLISADPIGEQMPGGGIRYYELARVLQAHADVTLAGLPADSPAPGDVEFVPYRFEDPSPLRAQIAGADAIFAPPPWPLVGGWIARSGARVIYDVANPAPLEVLEFLAGRPRLLRETVTTLTIDRYLSAFMGAHHLVCASDKQRDLWLGLMLAARLIEPAMYDRDPGLRSIVDTVPFGVPTEPPRPTGRGLRARFPEIGEEHEVVLWSGGIWRWLDAPTAIRAVARLNERRPQVRLVFMAASQAGGADRATAEARSVAAELGVLDSVVLFNDTWVPYAERADWLLESACAISTHVDHLETRFAFRTRMLDWFWAGLPIVCTRGDELADRVERETLGATVPPEDPEATADALERVLERGREAHAEGLARAAADYAWPRAAEALVRFVTATDRPARLGRGRGRRPLHAARDLAFRTGMGTLNRLGLRRWPSL